MTLDIYADLFDEDSDRLDSASAIRFIADQLRTGRSQIR
jgi:hypothetical protein